MNAAASRSVISRWKRCLKLRIGAPLPKQGSPLSCISATVASMPSATVRACNHFCWCEIIEVTAACTVLGLHNQPWHMQPHLRHAMTVTFGQLLSQDMAACKSPNLVCIRFSTPTTGCTSGDHVAYTVTTYHEYTHTRKHIHLPPGIL